jgi:hypothetical protein
MDATCKREWADNFTASERGSAEDVSDKEGRIAVVHLVRRANDLRCLETFIEAYRQYPAGLPHDLVFALKGFEPTEEEAVRSAARGLNWIPFPVADVGRDIGTYLTVASALSYDFFCFLNSFARPVAPDWLLKLYRALVTTPGAGVVGATGSWWRPSREQPFPNYNIRTNGFLIRRDVLLSLDLWEMRGRRDVVRFEAGPDGMTRQLMARGLEPYVVDADGLVWAKERWPISRTFWSRDQEALLIADNRTDWYATGRPRLRAWCRKIAWTGERAGRRPGRAPKWMRRLGMRVGLLPMPD